MRKTKSVMEEEIAVMMSTETTRVGLAIFLKPLYRSKTRLSHLSSFARSELAIAMARDVLEAVTECGTFDSVLMVSAEPAAGNLAAQYGAEQPADLADLTGHIAGSERPPRWTTSLLTAWSGKVAA